MYKKRYNPQYIPVVSRRKFPVRKEVIVVAESFNEHERKQALSLLEKMAWEACEIILTKHFLVGEGAYTKLFFANNTKPTAVLVNSNILGNGAYFNTAERNNIPLYILDSGIYKRWKRK